MAGHSKWSQIKHKKAITDQKRAKQFSKLLTAIQMAAKIDSNPDFNLRLRAAINKAKENNVPQENITRALTRAKDDLTEKENNVPQENITRALTRAKDDLTEDVIIEAYGPSGSAFIIKAITNNSNRTVAEIKKLLSDNNAKFALQGSVMWAFCLNEEGDFVPQFKQLASSEDIKKIDLLIEKLLGHPDIIEVYTNAK